MGPILSVPLRLIAELFFRLYYNCPVDSTRFDQARLLQGLQILEGDPQYTAEVARIQPRMPAVVDCLRSMNKGNTAMFQNVKDKDMYKVVTGAITFEDLPVDRLPFIAGREPRRVSETAVQALVACDTDTSFAQDYLQCPSTALEKVPLLPMMDVTST